MNGYKKTKYSGFTLLELLVVVSIITMLLSMMLPSLRSAREKSRQTKCLSNLRQLNVGWQLYCQNNDDRLPSPHTGGTADWIDALGRRHWVTDGELNPSNLIGGTEFAIRDGQLWEYLNNIDIFHCDSDKSGRLRGYALSFSMGGGQGEINDRDGLKPALKVNRTAGKLVFIDSEPGFDPEDDCPCIPEWLSGSFCPIKVKSRKWVRMTGRSDITARHDDGCNASFADGSAARWKWQDRQTIRYARKEIKDLSANPDFDKLLNAMTQYH